MEMSTKKWEIYTIAEDKEYYEGSYYSKDSVLEDFLEYKKEDDESCKTIVKYCKPKEVVNLWQGCQKTQTAML